MGEACGLPRWMTGSICLHPALLQARDAAGAIVPKVAALDATTWPDIDDRWVSFGAPIQSTRGVLRAAGRDWHVPSDDVVSVRRLSSQRHARFRSTTPRRILSRKPR